MLWRPFLIGTFLCLAGVVAGAAGWNAILRLQLPNPLAEDTQIVEILVKPDRDLPLLTITDPNEIASIMAECRRAEVVSTPIDPKPTSARVAIVTPFEIHTIRTTSLIGIDLSATLADACDCDFHAHLFPADSIAIETHRRERRQCGGNPFLPALKRALSERHNGAKLPP